MKKRDEGYVLPLVLIVLVVICLIAVSLLTVSLNNLKNQQAMIDRMEDQYAAQGKVEEAIQSVMKSINENPSLSDGIILPPIDGVEYSGSDFVSEASVERINWKETAESKTHKATIEIEARVPNGALVSVQVTFVVNDDGTKITDLKSMEYDIYEISTVEVTKNG